MLRWEACFTEINSDYIVACPLSQLIIVVQVLFYYTGSALWTYHNNFPPILHALLPESLHPLTYADNPGSILPPCSGTIGNLHIQMVKHPKTCTESQQLGCWKKCCLKTYNARSWSWVVKLGRLLLFPQSNSWFWPNLNMLWNIPRAIPSKWRLSMPQMQSSCFALCMARIIYHVGCQQSNAWKSRLCNDQNERNFHGAFIYSSLEKTCPRELMETAGAPLAIQGTRKQVNAEQTLVESQKCLRLWFSVLPSNNLQTCTWSAWLITKHQTHSLFFQTVSTGYWGHAHLQMENHMNFQSAWISIQHCSCD